MANVFQLGTSGSNTKDGFAVWQSYLLLEIFLKIVNFTEMITLHV